VFKKASMGLGFLGRRRGVPGLAVLAVTAAGVVGCGGGGSSSGAAPASAGSPLKSISVGAFPLTQLMLPYVARDEHDFSAQKLDVKITALAGSAVQEVPNVLSGHMDIGVSGLADLLPAIASGAPLVILPGFGTKIEPDLSTATNVIVAKDPQIRSLKDLVGKRVALNALGSAHQLYITLAMRRAGLDPKSVKFVQIPLPNIPGAIQKGQVDAGQALDPVLSLAHSLGEHDVLAIGADVAGNLPSAVYWTSKSWASAHPREIAAFTAAMKKAASRLESKPDIMRAYAAKYTKFDPKVVKSIKNFGAFTTTVTRADIDKVAGILADGKLISRHPAVSSYVYSS
jgi:NitT/TauT family transport system substrate-binding protein